MRKIVISARLIPLFATTQILSEFASVQVILHGLDDGIKDAAVQIFRQGAVSGFSEAIGTETAAELNANDCTEIWTSASAGLLVPPPRGAVDVLGVGVEPVRIIKWESFMFMYNRATADERANSECPPIYLFFVLSIIYLTLGCARQNPRILS
jgi:hypothetical protein